MALDRKKLIKLRNNIQAYLDKADREDKLGKFDLIIDDILQKKITPVESKLDETLMFLQNVDLGQAENLNSEVVMAIERLGNEIGKIKVEVPEQTDRTEEIVNAISNIRFPEINFPNVVSVDNFPPQRVPQPVTNININGLRGPVKSTALNVGATATALPASPLDNRRSLIVWNNDNNATLWIGGEDVTVGNGIPVKKQNYSPALDLSSEVTLYGVTDGATIDVRVLETSMTGVGA